jgi:hypothetical protein
MLVNITIACTNIKTVSQIRDGFLAFAEKAGNLNPVARGGGWGIDHLFDNPFTISVFLIS